jgi:hypothetical protein
MGKMPLLPLLLVTFFTRVPGLILAWMLLFLRLDAFMVRLLEKFFGRVPYECNYVETKRFFLFSHRLGSLFE